MSNSKVIWASGICFLACLSLFVGAARAEDGLWMTDFAAAKAKAKAEKKLLLLDFTGSDWCGWCIKLKQEVFDTEAFKADGPKNFVLVEVDFPQKKVLADALKAQNEKLQEEFKVQGFPTIYVLDAEGSAIAKSGYRPGGPQKYLEELNGFKTAHEAVVALQAKLPSAQGLDRAKMLDQILVAQEKLGIESPDDEKYSAEILTLDTDNKAGLKSKYTFKKLMAESEALGGEGKTDEARATCQKALAVPGITSENKQDAHFAEASFCFKTKDFPGIVSCLKQALEAAPQSEKAQQIGQLLKRYQSIADDQAAVAKLKVDADAAKGLDRAKLLDQLIEATSKLNMAMQSRKPTPEIDKWTQEILTLDADNKAGLKTKYEFRTLYMEAAHHFQAQEFDKATETINKALALPGLTDDLKAAADKLKTAMAAQKGK